jgi:hypothetical protein
MRTVLPAAASVAVQRRKGIAPTFDVRVRSGTSEHRFIAGWDGRGWPADVRRLSALVSDLDIVFAPRISPGAQAWLAEHGLGWIDEEGQASVSLQSGLIISRQTPVQQPARELPGGWTRATVAAAEAALAGVEPTVEKVERATGLSRGSTANALARLEALGLLRRPENRRGPGSARSIADYAALLDQYAAAVRTTRAKERTVLIHRLMQDPLSDLVTAIGPALDRQRTNWAATGTAASVLLAPYLSEVTIVELYVGGQLYDDPGKLAGVLHGRIVDKGHRIEVRRTPTRLTIEGPVIRGIHVAQPVRVYADLLATGGRAADAAYHLREVLHVGTGT